MDWLTQVPQALLTGAGLLWKAAWALALGYAFSALIQVFVSRSEAARHLGEPGLKQIGLAMGLGAISSSCSFAALSATRALFAKGAHLIPALAFLFASTNLVIELAVLLWIFLGWQFVLALYVGAFVLVASMAVLVRLTYSERLVEEARKAAQQAGGMNMDPSEGLPSSWGERLRVGEAWHRVGSTYIGEWKMVWKELLVGFSVAGLVATLIPQRAFETLFPEGLPGLILVPLHALLGPMLAVLTFIGSMGNGPLAAILWQNGVLFAGILAFLYADFVVPPSLKINATYYGWKFASYLALVFTIAAVVAGITVHLLFALLRLIPEPQGTIAEMATFAIDHTFWLNVFAAGVSAVLVWLARRAPEGGQGEAPLTQ